MSIWAHDDGRVLNGQRVTFTNGGQRWGQCITLGILQRYGLYEPQVLLFTEIYDLLLPEQRINVSLLANRNAYSV